MTRDDIIRGALKKLGAYDASDAIPAEELTDAAFALNTVTKELMAEGEVGLWLREQITLFLQEEQESYNIGSTSTDHATTSYSETTLSAAAAAAAASVVVTSATGFTVGYYIGVKLDDDTIDWTTISSVASTTIGLTATLNSAAASGNKVYVYQTKANRFQRPLDAFRRTTADLDTTVDIVSRTDYDALAQKDSSGPPTTMYYQPNLTLGKVYVWPTQPGSDTDKLVIVVERTIEDFDVTSDNPDFPIEWGNYLIWALAADLAPDYGLDLNDRLYLRKEADRKKERLLQYSQDDGSVSFKMDLNR